MTTAEQLAVAVLKGDELAIRALMDCLMEDMESGARLVLPTRVIGHGKNIKAVVFFHDNEEGIGRVIDHVQVDKAIEGWLREGGVLQMNNVDRLELYEFPQD